MRISEGRYARDLRRLQLAQRLIDLEVRTKAVRDWTGLSELRIRNLCKFYDPTWVGRPRHRGPAPTRAEAFLRSPALRSEASAIGGLAYALEVVPESSGSKARARVVDTEAGERLCDAFELYRRMVPGARFTMNQFLLLVAALAEGTDLELGWCSECRGALLIDPLGIKRRLCIACRDGASEPPERSNSVASLGESHAPYSGQQSLF